MKHVTYVKANHVEDQSIDKESMLYDTDTDYIHVLNPTAMEIWNMADRKHSEEDIVNHFIENYPQEEKKKLKKDIENTISDMLKKGIIIENL